MFHPARAHLDPASIWLRRWIAEISPGVGLCERSDLVLRSLRTLRVA